MDANKLLLSPTHADHCSLFFTSHGCSLALIPEIPPQGSVGPTQTTTIQVEWLIIYFVAPAFFWLCNHRLVTLQSRTCDFVITGSVLQSWFKPNFSNTSFLLSFPFRSSFAILAAPVKVLLPLVAKPSENSLGEGKKSSWSQRSGSQKESATSSGNFSSHLPACLRSVCKPAAFKDGTLPTPFWARAWAIEILTNLQICCRFKRNSIKSRLISTEILTNIEIIFCLKGNSIESILISIRSWSLVTSTYEVDFLGEEP